MMRKAYDLDEERAVLEKYKTHKETLSTHRNFSNCKYTYLVFYSGVVECLDCLAKFYVLGSGEIIPVNYKFWQLTCDQICIRSVLY
jgi:hypothetical protein